MTHHIALVADAKEQFQFPNTAQTHLQRILFLDGAATSPRFRSTFWQVMDASQLSPRPIATDLYRVAASVYAADLAVPRVMGFDRWTRHIALYLPVNEFTQWNAARTGLETFLSFLSGDRWELHFRHRPIHRPLVDKRAWKRGTRPRTSTVALFSGGLDSFVGAIELTMGEKSACFVGHQDEPITKNRQDRLSACFHTHRPHAQAPFLQFFVQAPKLWSGQAETSKRSRSFLFLSLGSIVLDSLQGTELLVPENGLIALNAPLAPTRLGSLTTRTTHPYTLRLFQDLLIALGITASVRNPYAYSTKGEMVASLAADPIFTSCFERSLSCAHPAADRWLGGHPGDHCGYCVPCLIRRAALHHAGVTSAERYAMDILRQRPEKGKSYDVRAFLIAIESLKTSSPVARVLGTGPIEPAAVGQYVDVYERGMSELDTFLETRRWRKFR